MKETLEFVPLWLQNSPDLNPVDYSMLKVFNTRITDLDEPKQQLRTKRDKLDHVVIVAAICQWHRQWVEISDVCFVHLLLQYSVDAVIRSGEFDATVKVR